MASKIKSKLGKNLLTIASTILITLLINDGIHKFQNKEKNNLLTKVKHSYHEIIRDNLEISNFYNGLLRYMTNQNINSLKIDDKKYTKNNLIENIENIKKGINYDTGKLNSIENLIDSKKILNYAKMNSKYLSEEAESTKNQLKEIYKEQVIFYKINTTFTQINKTAK